MADNDATNEIRQEIAALQLPGIFNRSLYEKIYQLDDPFMITELECKLQEKAKEMKLSTQVKNLCTEVRREARQKKKAMQTALPSKSGIENVINYEPDVDNKSYPSMACGSWFASEAGVYTSDPSLPGQITACYHPILPVRILTNIQTSEERITIAFKKYGRWKEVTVPRTVVANSRSIIALAANGVSVTSENAKYLVKFLSDVENWNADIIPVQRSTTKLGWDGSLCFVPYDGEIVFDGEQLFRQLFDSVTEKGSFEKWLDCVKTLRAEGNIIARLAVAASFASILIEPLGSLPFIVDFHGETGGGKTVTLMLAASVWADPDVGGGFITNLKSTSVNLEARSDMLNNLPVLLDDTSHADRRIVENFESTIYDLCSGTGKGRSNKMLGTDRQRSWKNVIISNGEKPLSSYVSQGGAINRLLEIECNEDIFQDPKKIAGIVKKNYGHAGRRFVECVKTMAVQDIKEICRRFEDELTTDQSMQKQIAAMAAVLTADYIATEKLFRDGKALKADDVKDFLTRRDEVSDNIRCFMYLMDVLSENDNRFNGETPLEQWGTMGLSEEGEEVVFFYPHAFEKLLKQEGYSRRAFTSWAKKMGLLIWNQQKGRPSADTFVRKISGNKTKRYIALKTNFDPDAMTDEENKNDFETYEGEPVFD